MRKNECRGFSQTHARQNITGVGGTVGDGYDQDTLYKDEKFKKR